MDSVIIPSSNRIFHQTSWCSRYTTHVSHMELNNLVTRVLSIEEITLAQSKELILTDGVERIMMPINSSLEISNEKFHSEINPSQILSLKDGKINLQNRGSTDAGFFLFNLNTKYTQEFKIHDFQIDDNENSFVELPENGKLMLLEFSGKMEKMALVPNDRALAFVLFGAFDIEGRLIENKDAIYFYNLIGRRLEVESLAAQGLLLILSI